MTSTDKRTVTSTATSSWVADFLNKHKVDSLDFCEPGTLTCLCQCWINFLKETWEIKAVKKTINVRIEKEQTGVLWWLLTCRPVFQKTQKGWVTVPRGALERTQGHPQGSAESPPHPAEKQTPHLSFNTPVCLCVNGRRAACTHRRAVGVGQREHDSQWRVDQWRPCKVCSYFSLHIFLKVCVNFKDSFNPLVRKEVKFSKNRGEKELLFNNKLWIPDMLTGSQCAHWAFSIVWVVSGEDLHQCPRYPPATPAREVWTQLGGGGGGGIY